MTVESVLGLFTGIIFFFVGIGGFFFAKEKKWLFVLFFVFGSWLTYIFTIGPLSYSKQKLDSIIYIESDVVNEIIVKPTRRRGEHIKSIVNKDFKIVNRNSIEEICKVLNKTEYASAGYLKGADSLSIIEIRMNLDTIKFGIRKRGIKTGLDVHSNGDSGWSYGTLKCENLGNTIQNILKKESQH